MSVKLVVCWICLWITVTNVSTKYVPSNESISWHEAWKRSNFATPKIQIDKSSFSVDLTFNIRNIELWVGYYKKETAFAYIGCGPISDRNPTVILLESRNTPGLCYSMCNKSDNVKTYIGLKKDKCFCMIKRPSENIYLSGCNVSYNGTWISGGDEYMSVYERLKIDMGSSQISGKCLHFQDRFPAVWGLCGGPYHALCKNDIDGNVTFSNFGYFGWEKYVQTCYKNKMYPITYNDTTTLSIKLATGETWTNVIGSDVIYKYNEASNSINRGIGETTYGYIARHGYKTVLYFTSDSSINRSFLQTLPATTDKIWTSTTSHMSRTYTTRNNIGTNNVTINTINQSKVPATTDKIWTSTTSHMSRTYTTRNNIGTNNVTINTINQSKGSHVSIAVSVSVVIVVIVAAVVTLIILKRGGKIPSICIKSPALDKSSKRTSDSFPTKNNEYFESQETAYAQIDVPKANNIADSRQDLELSNGHYAHTYFVLESGSRESNTDVDISDPGKDNTNINDDYNTLHETVNVRLKKGNDTYDTTEKAALKVKARQTAENEQESPKMLNETEEDTYNRIDRSPLKNGKTDNIYGISNCLENDYGDVGKSREKNLQDGDDTYNHVKLNQ